jgi:hypothetical protein
MSPVLAHHVNIAGKAICPELDEKRKCFARARTLSRLRPPQQLRQLGDVDGDPPGLIIFCSASSPPCDGRAPPRSRRTRALNYSAPSASSKVEGDQEPESYNLRDRHEGRRSFGPDAGCAYQRQLCEGIALRRQAEKGLP